MQMKKFILLGATAVALQAGFTQAHANEYDGQPEQTAEQKAQGEANAQKLKSFFGGLVDKTKQVANSTVDSVKGAKTVGDKLPSNNVSNNQSSSETGVSQGEDNLAKAKEVAGNVFNKGKQLATSTVQGVKTASNAVVKTVGDKLPSGQSPEIQQQSNGANGAAPTIEPNTLGNSAGAKQLSQNTETLKGNITNLLNKFRSNDTGNENKPKPQ